MRCCRAIWLFFLALCFCLSPVSSVSAAGLFSPAASAPVILIGEVQCYGDEELKSNYFNTFADKLAEALTAQGLSVIGRPDMTNEAGRHDEEGSSYEDMQLSYIHMDAIIRGHQFDRGEAAAKLGHYADETMGRAYFHDEERIAAWHSQPQQTYALSPAKEEAMQAIGRKYGADYLLFVNLKQVDVRLKHSIFATHTDRETRGKKISAALDYYLLDVASGRVYEGHCENKKTAELLNFGLGKMGKGMNIDMLLSEVMEAQTNDLVDDLEKNGLPSLP